MAAVEAREGEISGSAVASFSIFPFKLDISFVSGLLGTAVTSSPTFSSFLSPSLTLSSSSSPLLPMSESDSMADSFSPPPSEGTDSSARGEGGGKSRLLSRV